MESGGPTAFLGCRAQGLRVIGCRCWRVFALGCRIQRFHVGVSQNKGLKGP